MMILALATGLRFSTRGAPLLPIEVSPLLALDSERKGTKALLVPGRP
ncbi:Uncharacterised protein [Klebsiella pneumoniae]|nr:Uncharacterised protein [Klebsiella pneumoniae]